MSTVQVASPLSYKFQTFDQITDRLGSPSPYSREQIIVSRCDIIGVWEQFIQKVSPQEKYHFQCYYSSSYLSNVAKVSPGASELAKTSLVALRKLGFDVKCKELFLPLLSSSHHLLSTFAKTEESYDFQLAFHLAKETCASEVVALVRKVFNEKKPVSEEELKKVSFNDEIMLKASEQLNAGEKRIFDLVMSQTSFADSFKKAIGCEDQSQIAFAKIKALLEEQVDASLMITRLSQVVEIATSLTPTEIDNVTNKLGPQQGSNFKSIISQFSKQ